MLHSEFHSIPIATVICLNACMCVYIFILYSTVQKFEVTFFINFYSARTFTFFQDIWNVTKEIGFKYVLLLWTLKSSKNPEKSITVSTKILSRKNFNMVLEHQISILEWFLKNHVTLMIRVMMLKIQLQEEITYSNIFKWKSSDLVVTIFPISQFYSFFIFLFFK